MFTVSCEQDAYATIRGYVHQVEVTLKRWVELNDGQRLELEHGEDIDLISRDEIGLRQAVAGDAEAQERLLEQIKDYKDAITLNSEAVCQSVCDFFEHRMANPNQALRFLFSTTAPVTKERPALSTLLKRLSQNPSCSECDHRAPQTQLRSESAFKTRPPNSQRPKPVQPRKRTLHHPPTRHSSLLKLARLRREHHPLIGNVQLVIQAPQVFSQRPHVIALIPTQVLLDHPRIGTPEHERPR